MAKIKGIGMVGIAKALRSRRDDAARALPESMHHYLDEHISISEWYPEQDYLALLRVYVAVWSGRTFEEVGRLAANEALSTVYRNILIGGVSDAVKRMKVNWQNYHDTGELNSEVLPGLIRVRVRGYGMKARELCALNQGYFAELLRLSGAEVTALRKPQCTSSGDRECMWEFDWRAAAEPPGLDRAAACAASRAALVTSGMKAAVYYANGGPEVLRYEDVPDPVCPPNGLLVRVAAVSIEGGDTVNRWGGPLTAHPHIVGYQASGEIVEVGPDVSGFKVGQKVTTTGVSGSHAELRAVSALTAWLVPEGMDMRVAAAIPIPFGTADNCLFEYGKLQAGNTVLIQAGASGVGVAAIQLAKRAGALVLATASSDERLARLAPLGMDHGINSKREDVVKAVMRITSGKGVHVALDGNGGASLQASVRSLAWKGRVTFIGVSERDGAKVDAGYLIQGNRSLIGVALGMEMTTPRVRAMVQRLVEEIARGELKVLLDREFPLAEAAAAHAYIESRQAVGRVLLIP